MLLQGQNNAVGYNGSQDHVLKWSIKVKERLNFKMHLFHFHHVMCGIVFVDIKLTFDAFSPLKQKPCIIYCWEYIVESYRCTHDSSRWLTISNHFQWFARSALHCHWVIACRSGPIEDLWIAREATSRHCSRDENISPVRPSDYATTILFFLLLF